MTNQLDEISKDFRDFELLEFERDFAKNCGKYSNTKQEFVDAFGYENQQHYNPYAFFKDSLEYKLDDHLIDLREGNYKSIVKDLDKFLKQKNIDIDADSDDYLVLCRRFLLNRIDTFFSKLKIVDGEYEETFKNESKPSDVLLNKFHQFENLQWDEVTFNIITNESIQITARGYKEEYSYQEIGFKDKRTSGKHSKLWGTLLAFGNMNGQIDWSSSDKVKDSKKLKKDVDRIGKKLILFTGISDKPFHTYNKSRGYQTKFRFIDKRQN